MFQFGHYAVNLLKKTQLIQQYLAAVNTLCLMLLRPITTIKSLPNTLIMKF